MLIFFGSNKWTSTTLKYYIISEKLECHFSCFLNPTLSRPDFFFITLLHPLLCEDIHLWRYSTQLQVSNLYIHICEFVSLHFSPRCIWLLPACVVFFCVLRVFGDYLVFGLLDLYGFNGLFAICEILKVFGHGFWLKIGFFLGGFLGHN